MNFLYHVHNLLAAPVQAACDFNSADGIDLGNCYALNESTTVRDTFGTPSAMINIVMTNLFILAGIIFFFMIIYAGFKMIGDAKGKEDARAILRTALIGILIMFSAYWIVQILQFITKTELIPGTSAPQQQQAAP